MSKLYNEYLRLKSISSNNIYLFKSGIFYIALEDDAVQLSNLFDFKLTPLNENVIKCGFPETRILYYSELLQKNNIAFKIVTASSSQISTYSNFMRNEKLQEILKTLNELNMDTMTCLQAFNTLYELSKTVKSFYNKEENLNEQ